MDTIEAIRRYRFKVNIVSKEQFSKTIADDSYLEKQLRSLDTLALIKREKRESEE